MNKTKITIFLIAFSIIIIMAIMFGHLARVIKTGSWFQINSTSTTMPTTSIASTSIIPGSNGTYLQNCSGMYIYENAINHSVTYSCRWSGGDIGMWVASGSSTAVRVMITGSDGNTYLDDLSNYSCTTFLTSKNLSAQNYTVTFTTYGNGGTCSDPHQKLILNNTTTPPYTNVYDFVYNGNFSHGNYAGWNATTSAFGQYPTNISVINNDTCFRMYKWSGLNGTYFATTASCYLPPMAGNITSSYFNVTMPFLNFQIVSPKNTTSYIMILHNGTPKIQASFNTYAQDTGNYLYKFQNVTIPLSTLVGKTVQMRIVSYIVGIQPTNKAMVRPLSDFIAVSDIHLSKTPWQQYQNLTLSIKQV